MLTKRQKIKIIIYSALLLIFIISLVWWFYYNTLRIRDYQRLGDMRILEAEMNDYFFKFNTYQVPGCSDGMLINFCTGREGQMLNVSSLIDPVNSDSSRYQLVQMTNDDFRLEFYLETRIAGLSSGKYALTKAGLGR